MHINDNRRFFLTFIKIFIVLLTILVILPYIVDLVMDLFSGGMAPGNNSIIVYKELVENQAVIGRFFSILKKIIIFM
ncbi:MAG TPA: hypothetical protein VEB00_07520 [Clostridia bacterium]|nr:hypothetical protein [Clostridia bacterium]